MTNPENWLVLLWLWPITGWVCAFIMAPRDWETREFIFGVFLILFCGAVVGPVGLFWLTQERE